MDCKHDFIEAFQRLTAAIKQQTRGIIRFDDSITKPFLSTATPANTTGLKEFADAITQKGVFPRLDAAATYGVVVSALQYPPCPSLSKVVYHFIANLELYNNVETSTLALRAQDQSIDPSKEAKRRVKVVSTSLILRLQDVLFDETKHVKVRRLAAEMLANLCVGNKRACRTLVGDGKTPSLGFLLRHSVDGALRMHLTDIVRHLRANEIDLSLIWDKTDDSAMDFPSSAELSTPCVTRILDSISSMNTDATFEGRSSKIYRVIDINVPEQHVHAGSNSSALVLDKDIMIFVSAKKKLLDCYEIPLQKPIELEVIDTPGAPSMVHLRFEPGGGYWWHKGKKGALTGLTLQFSKEIQTGFLEDFRKFQARASERTTTTDLDSQQDSQQLSLSMLKFPDADDSTDIEDVLDNPATPRQGQPRVATASVATEGKQQIASDNIVQSRNPSSVVFARNPEIQKQEGCAEKKTLDIKGLADLQTSKGKQTPKLSKKDEQAVQKPTDTSPLQNLLRDSSKDQGFLRPGLKSTFDPVLTLPPDQHGDCNYNDSLNPVRNPASLSRRVEDSQYLSDRSFVVTHTRRTTQLAQHVTIPPKRKGSHTCLDRPKTSMTTAPSVNVEDLPKNKARHVMHKPSRPAAEDAEDAEDNPRLKDLETDYNLPVSEDSDAREAESKKKPARRDNRSKRHATEGLDPKDNSVKHSGGQKTARLPKKVTRKAAHLTNTLNSPPLPARRSKRKTTQKSSIYTEKQSSGEGEADMEIEPRASAPKSKSNSVAESQKLAVTRGTLSNVSSAQSKKPPGASRQDAVVIDSSDHEHDEQTHNRHSTNIKAGDVNDPAIPLDARENQTIIDGHDAEIVQDSYPKVQESHAQCTDSVDNLPRVSEDHNSPKRALPDAESIHHERQDSKGNAPIVSKLITPIHVKPPGHKVSNNIAHGSGKSLHTREGGPSHANTKDSITVERLQNSPIVHFARDGPRNQGVPQHETTIYKASGINDTEPRTVNERVCGLSVESIVAEHTSNVTSSEIVVNRLSATAGTSNSKLHISPVLHGRQQRSISSHSEGTGDQELSSSDENSISDNRSEESDFESSRLIDQSPVTKPVRRTRQTAVVELDEVDLPRDLAGVNQSELRGQTQGQAAATRRVDRMATMQIQMPKQEDTIARIAREKNPRAHDRIEFTGFKPNSNTHVVFSRMSEARIETVRPLKELDTNTVKTGIRPAKVAADQVDSPRPTGVKEKQSMPPPRRPCGKAVGEGSQHRDAHIEKNHANVAPGGNKETSISAIYIRKRPVCHRPSTPVPLQYQQSTPAPFTHRLLAAQSPESCSEVENNHRSETGETTLVDNTCLFIRPGRARSPCDLSSRVSEASASPQPDRQRHPYSNKHRAGHQNDADNDIRSDIQQTVVAIAQQILFRVDEEERLARGMVDSYRTGCEETLRELKQNAALRLKHDASKVKDTIEQTRKKLQNASRLVETLADAQVEVKAAVSADRASVQVCSNILEVMLDKMSGHSA